MTDADGRLIPLVEDDQGEGIKDFVDEIPETDVLKEALLKQEIALANQGGKVDEKHLAFNNQLREINDKLDRLLEVFGDCRLIEGRFVDIKKGIKL